MAVKKSEIYSSLWASCDALRGGMDASQYKDYVLVLLFVKYVSDKYAGDPNGVIDVPAGGSFADMLALRGQKDIGEKMNTIIARLAEANDLKGVIDVADFDDPDKLGSGKEMVDRLSSLVGIFSRKELDFRKNRAEGDDILGDAYEYLMRHFATESGKSKGQFYTPAEVSRIMAKAIGIGSARSAAQTIYDPTCGSGSLLLKAHDEAPFDLTIYGQEKDVATRALARMNMVLHNCPTAEIWRDNTLSAPHFVNNDGSLKTFDFVVANPPFSDKAWSTGLDAAHDQFDRFEPGVPPVKNGDYAYLLHVVASLKSTGKGAIVMPHGVLFRGNAEAEIRRTLIRRGIIKGIIGLPANLFYGTGIPACIIVLDKENAHARTGIFMIDASKGFVKDGNKNRLRDQDLHKIVDAFTRQLTIERYSRMVPLAEIEQQDFNLNIPRYIDSAAPEDLQDIEAHLKGGIPVRDIDALAPYWAVLPSVRAALFGPGDRAGYATPKVAPSAVKQTILDHPEFAGFAAQMRGVFAGWRAAHLEALRSIAIGDKPKRLIDTLAEDLLARCAELPLIDRYDVYQHLMTYWAETMQDDVYLLALEGWAVARVIRDLVKNEDGKFTETPDITLGKRKLKAELIPPPLIAARFFADALASCEALDAKAEELVREIEELDEEQGGEDGLLFDAKTDKGKLTAKSVKDRLKEIKGDRTAEDERVALQNCLRLIEREKAAADAAKAARTALDEAIVRRYATLTNAELRQLLVEDKWFSVLEAAIVGELDRVGQSLTGRVKLLTERYAVPLSNLTVEVEVLSATVDAHLKRMGFVW
ncbi:MAG: type I restriction endonuclease subunit M [Acidiphilium sp. 37-64-53]|uniref:type I restriction-modification system subunit M n=1 Tax=Acidiphilium TaxID=522 RepID=UPI000BDA8089|nr:MULTISPECIES: class I SAM-dependent DNA methyltransferase [Acidiphilium]OYV99634.1 MAG: type I restriction endonuclease subunit M [Acidiphilium sp. 37-64-53]OZB21590.1 MAG: type I restriction endonuclease subunit M [Acidiphilium sp. 34-64-41]HQT86854.1 class I SAM-dependent DNA methyltransferase [Acidiphilium rubrum]